MEGPRGGAAVVARNNPPGRRIGNAHDPAYRDVVSNPGQFLAGWGSGAARTRPWRWRKVLGLAPTARRKAKVKLEGEAACRLTDLLVSVKQLIKKAIVRP